MTAEASEPDAQTRELFLEPVVPLLAALEKRVTQRVTLHLIGGMAVYGRLESVNDDLTVTVTDLQDQSENTVVISAIAVLEVK